MSIYLSQFKKLILILAFVLFLAAPEGRADQGKEDPVSGIFAELRELGGSGWGSSGPGGECIPTESLNCHDAATVRNVIREALDMVAKLVGMQPNDPTFLALIERVQGARSETKQTYLIFTLHFDDDFTYEVPVPPNGGEGLVRTLTFPRELKLNVFSNGAGTFVFQRPSRKWRLSSLKVRTASVPVEVYLSEFRVNVLKQTVELKVSIWDVVTISNQATFDHFNFKVDKVKTILDNLLLILLPWAGF